MAGVRAIVELGASFGVGLGAAGGAGSHGQSVGYASSSLSITVKMSPGSLPGGIVTSSLFPLGGRTKMVCAEEAVFSGIAKV